MMQASQIRTCCDNPNPVNSHKGILSCLKFQIRSWCFKFLVCSHTSFKHGGTVWRIALHIQIWLRQPCPSWKSGERRRRWRWYLFCFFIFFTVVLLFYMEFAFENFGNFNSGIANAFNNITHKWRESCYFLWMFVGPPHYYTGSDPKADYEFNVWTKPDMGGTQFENGNR